VSSAAVSESLLQQFQVALEYVPLELSSGKKQKPFLARLP